MTDLAALIDEVIRYSSSTTSNNQFILSYDGDWYAGIGNPSQHVCLGESSAEVRGVDCATPLEAVTSLLIKLKLINRVGSNG
jgi:hypothetical protein